MYSFYNPIEAIEVIGRTNFKRAQEEKNKILLTGILGGMFISLAGIGQLTILQNINPQNETFVKFLGAAIFPVGLLLCLLLGGTLFTGNSLIILNLINKEIKIKEVVRNLSITWLGNFIGGGVVAYISYFAGIFKTLPMQTASINIAMNKLNLNTYECLLSGFLCNILVIAGIWLSTSSKDSSGKIYGCWFPIMLFVISGYQHVVANMFFITIAKLISPEKINFLQTLLTHFLPVTVGNFLSGGIFFPIVFHYLYVHRK
ncbi:MAG: formate/nitrite transporter family protein [Fusobacterium perfoetens]|uniref:formate/nitrite transporter family protein n=1 Tax=Fusobacterium perfoetens TaxID=852 RepID=UPI0023F0CC24|nr:formate/nitrite transporter family protein [Fusobacterium perfoetens]MCI6152141.1 formate/nitrite transporter family protein [Fusobacterium perfoetens]MDY3237968.1 formate/nitrite transporter family protein [Fusobacterium perfoetens]